MRAMSSAGRPENPSSIKVQIFGIGVSVVDYDSACETILAAAGQRKSFTVSALAVHGLMEAVDDPKFARIVNGIDLVTPDGQPIRWAMNLLYSLGMLDRVYGPDLTDLVCAKAAELGIGVYIYGSTASTCTKMAEQLRLKHPKINIVGVQPDRFRKPTREEDDEDIQRINDSKAGIVCVGLGCPRQERWISEHKGRINAAMLGVGAAFDYFAGNLRRPPAWAQKAGLEWLFRFAQEPRRLFKRYTVTNVRFLFLLGATFIWSQFRKFFNKVQIRHGNRKV